MLQMRGGLEGQFIIRPGSSESQRFSSRVDFFVLLAFVWRASADNELCNAAALLCLQMESLLFLTGFRADGGGVRALLLVLDLRLIKRLVKG